MTSPDRAVIYVRQSKERGDSVSKEIQETMCRDYCARQGYDVVKVVIEPGSVRGSLPWDRRPAFPQARDADADVFVVYRWSRLSRRRGDQYRLIEMLEEGGKRVESAQEPYDPSTAGGKLSRGMMLELAAFESDLKSEQWREAMQRRRDLQLPAGGKARYGYKLGEGKDEPQVPDPETAPVLVEMYQRFIGGCGAVTLTKEFNRRGIPSPNGREWITKTIYNVLDSGFGAGLLVQTNRDHKVTGYLPGKHQPVITMDEWQAYQDERKKRRKTQAPRRERWWLAGLVFCGLCGAPLVRTSATSTTCQRKQRGMCPGINISQRILARAVNAWTFMHLSELADTLPTRNAEVRELQEQLEELTRSRQGVTEVLGQLADLRASGELDSDGYQAARDRRRAEADDLDERMRTLRDEMARISVALPDDTELNEAAAADQAIEELASRLESAPDQSPSEYGRSLGQILRRVDVFHDRLELVPILGEVEIVARQYRAGSKRGAK